MRVQVKLYATLREYAPPNTEIGASFIVEFDGSTLGELVQRLGFEIDRAKIVMINGNRVVDMNALVKEDDLVVIFPPIGGG
jgi:molybdopterin synthase sulfur carrier subunit